MTFVKGQLKTPGSGRRKHERNKLSHDIKAAFRLHGDELVEALLALTKSKDERVRRGCCRQGPQVHGAGGVLEITSERQKAWP